MTATPSSPTPAPTPARIEALLAHREWVRALARSLVRDESSVDDVVQQTWQAALENPPSKLGAARAWLGSVVRRTVLDSQRRHVRRQRREHGVARPEGLPATADVVARAEIDRAVVNSVSELPEPYRTTLLLRFYDGLPPRDVAARMNIPVETVRARVRRGLERVRVGLDGRHGGDRNEWHAALVPFLAGPGGLVAADAGLGPDASGATTTPAGAGAATTPLGALATTLAIAVVSIAVGVLGGRLVRSFSAERSAGAHAPTTATVAARKRFLAADRSAVIRTRARIAELNASATALEERLADVRSAEAAALATATARSAIASRGDDRPSFERPFQFPAFDAELERVDWDDLGDHVARLVAALGEIYEDVNAGRELRPEAVGQLQVHNGALLMVVGPLEEVFPGGAANDALTHPAFMATMVAALCHTQELPLSEAQITALDRAAHDASAAVDRALESRRTHTFRLEALIVEAHAKSAFTDVLRSLLSDEQRALLGREDARGVVGYDLFGPGPMWVGGLDTGRFPASVDAGSRIARGIGRALELDAAQQEAANRVIAEWFQSLPHEYLERASSPVEERDEAYRLDVVLASAQQMLDMMRRVDALDLSDAQREAIRNSREVLVLRRTK